MAKGSGAIAAGWSCKKTVSGAIDARFPGLLLMLKEKTQRQWSKPDFHRPATCIGKNISPLWA
jgi:hypothetical protein